MYGLLEDGDQLNPSAVQLGDHLIFPGDRIERIGKKRRSMFEMQDGYYLVYQGMCDSKLLFTSEPTGCDGKPWYYAFCYIDATTLIVGNHKGMADIKVDELIFKGGS
jgi:hypothetical protein